jgi:hypothetical protein
MEIRCDGMSKPVPDDWRPSARYPIVGAPGGRPIDTGFAEPTDSGGSGRCCGTVVVARRGGLSTCSVVCRGSFTGWCQDAAEIGAGAGVACVVFSEYCVYGSVTRTSRAG